MNVLNQNKLTSNRSSTEQDKRCPLCLSDPFMSTNDKTKEWADQAKLQEHMSSEKHSRFTTWERKMRAEHAIGGVTNDWKCPYCPDDAKTLSTFNELVHHIKTSDASSTSAEHEQLKADDGWLDDDWMGTKLTASQRGTEATLTRLILVRVGTLLFHILHSCLARCHTPKTRTCSSATGKISTNHLLPESVRFLSTRSSMSWLISLSLHVWSGCSRRSHWRR